MMILIILPWKSSLLCWQDISEKRVIILSLKSQVQVGYTSKWHYCPWWATSCVCGRVCWETRYRRLSSTQDLDLDLDHPGNCGLHIWWCWCLASRLIRGWGQEGSPNAPWQKASHAPTHLTALSISLLPTDQNQTNKVAIFRQSACVLHCLILASIWKAVWATWSGFESRFNQVSTQSVLQLSKPYVFHIRCFGG